MLKFWTALAWLLIGTTLPAHGELVSTERSVVCGWMNEARPPPVIFEHRAVFVEDIYGCTLNRIILGATAGDLPPNDLALYAQGEGSVVNQVKLVVKIHRISGADSAKEELVRSLRKLSENLTGVYLPDAIIQAVRGSLYWSQTVGIATMKIDSKDLPTGTGYEVQVTIE